MSQEAIAIVVGHSRPGHSMVHMLKAKREQVVDNCDTATIARMTLYYTIAVCETCAVASVRCSRRRLQICGGGLKFCDAASVQYQDGIDRSMFVK